MNILLIVLMIVCLVMTVWVLILDTKVEQLEGYVERIKKERDNELR